MSDFDQLLFEGGNAHEIASAALLMAEATLQDPLADAADRGAARSLLDRGSETITELLLSQRRFDEISDVALPVGTALTPSEDATEGTDEPATAESSSPRPHRRVAGPRGASGMTDPIRAFLASLRNATAARQDVANLGASGLNVSIAKLLKEEGYITDYTIKGKNVFRRRLIVELKYVPGPRQKLDFLYPLDLAEKLSTYKLITRPDIRIKRRPPY